MMQRTRRRWASAHTKFFSLVLILSISLGPTSAGACPEPFDSVRPEPSRRTNVAQDGLGRRALREPNTLEGSQRSGLEDALQRPLSKSPAAGLEETVLRATLDNWDAVLSTLQEHNPWKVDVLDGSQVPPRPMGGTTNIPEIDRQGAPYPLYQAVVAAVALSVLGHSERIRYELEVLKGEPNVPVDRTSARIIVHPAYNIPAAGLEERWLRGGEAVEVLRSWPHDVVPSVSIESGSVSLKPPQRKSDLTTQAPASEREPLLYSASDGFVVRVEDPQGLLDDQTEMYFARQINQLLARRGVRKSIASLATGLEEVEELVEQYPELLGDIPPQAQAARRERIEQYRALLQQDRVQKAGWNPRNVASFLQALHGLWPFIQERLPDLAPYSYMVLKADPRQDTLVHGPGWPGHFGFVLNLDPGVKGRVAEEALWQAPYLILSAFGELLARIRFKDPAASPEHWRESVEGATPEELEAVGQSPFVGPRPAKEYLTSNQLERVVIGQRIAGGLPDHPWLDVPELMELEILNPNLWELMELSAGGIGGGRTLQRVLADRLALLLAESISKDLLPVVEEAILWNIEGRTDALERHLQGRASLGKLMNQVTHLSSIHPPAVLVFPLVGGPLELRGEEERTAMLLLEKRWEENAALLSGVAYAQALLPSLMRNEELLKDVKQERLSRRLQDLAIRILDDLASLKGLTLQVVHERPGFVRLQNADWNDLYTRLLTAEKRLVRETHLRTDAGLEEEWLSFPSAKQEVFNLMTQAAGQGVRSIYVNILPEKTQPHFIQPGGTDVKVKISWKELPRTGWREYSTQPEGIAAVLEQVDAIAEALKGPEVRIRVSGFGPEEDKATRLQRLVEGTIFYNPDGPDLIVRLRRKPAAGLEEDIERAKEPGERTGKIRLENLRYLAEAMAILTESGKSLDQIFEDPHTLELLKEIEIGISPKAALQLFLYVVFGEPAPRESLSSEQLKRLSQRHLSDRGAKEKVYLLPGIISSVEEVWKRSGTLDEGASLFRSLVGTDFAGIQLPVPLAYSPTLPPEELKSMISRVGEVSDFSSGLEEVEELVEQYPELLGDIPPQDQAARRERIEQYRALLQQDRVQKAGWNPRNVASFLQALHGLWPFIQEHLSNFPSYSYVVLKADDRQDTFFHEPGWPGHFGFVLNLHPGREVRSAEETLWQTPYLIFSAVGDMLAGIRFKNPESPENWKGSFMGATPEELQAIAQQPVVGSMPAAKFLTSQQLERVVVAQRIAGGLLDNPWLDVPELVELDISKPNLWELMAISAGAIRGGRTLQRVLADRIALLLAQGISEDLLGMVEGAILWNIERWTESLESYLTDRGSADKLIESIISSDLTHPQTIMVSPLIVGPKEVRPEQGKEAMNVLEKRWEENAALLSSVTYAQALLTFLKDEELSRRIQQDRFPRRLLNLADRILADFSSLKESAPQILHGHPVSDRFHTEDWKDLFDRMLTANKRLVRQTHLRTAAGGSTLLTTGLEEDYKTRRQMEATTGYVTLGHWPFPPSRYLRVVSNAKEGMKTLLALLPEGQMRRLMIGRRPRTAFNMEAFIWVRSKEGVIEFRPRSLVREEPWRPLPRRKGDFFLYSKNLSISLVRFPKDKKWAHQWQALRQNAMEVTSQELLSGSVSLAARVSGRQPPEVLADFSPTQSVKMERQAGRRFLLKKVPPSGKHTLRKPEVWNTRIGRQPQLFTRMIVQREDRQIFHLFKGGEIPQDLLEGLDYVVVSPNRYISVVRLSDYDKIQRAILLKRIGEFPEVDEKGNSITTKEAKRPATQETPSMPHGSKAMDEPKFRVGQRIFFPDTEETRQVMGIIPAYREDELKVATQKIDPLSNLFVAGSKEAFTVSSLEKRGAQPVSAGLESHSPWHLNGPWPMGQLFETISRETYKLAHDGAVTLIIYTPDRREQAELIKYPGGLSQWIEDVSRLGPELNLSQGAEEKRWFMEVSAVEWRKDQTYLHVTLTPFEAKWIHFKPSPPETVESYLRKALDVSRAIAGSEGAENFEIIIRDASEKVGLSFKAHPDSEGIQEIFNEEILEEFRQWSPGFLDKFAEEWIDWEEQETSLQAPADRTKGTTRVVTLALHPVLAAGLEEPIGSSQLKDFLVYVDEHRLYASLRWPREWAQNPLVRIEGERSALAGIPKGFEFRLDDFDKSDGKIGWVDVSNLELAGFLASHPDYFARNPTSSPSALQPAGLEEGLLAYHGALADRINRGRIFHVELDGRGIIQKLFLRTPVHDGVFQVYLHLYGPTQFHSFENARLLYYDPSTGLASMHAITGGIELYNTKGDQVAWLYPGDGFQLPKEEWIRLRDAIVRGGGVASVTIEKALPPKLERYSRERLRKHLVDLGGPGSLIPVSGTATLNLNNGGKVLIYIAPHGWSMGQVDPAAGLEERIQRTVGLVKDHYPSHSIPAELLEGFLRGEIPLQEAMNRLMRAAPTLDAKIARTILVTAWLTNKYGFDRLGMSGITAYLLGGSSEETIGAMREDQGGMSLKWARSILKEADALLVQGLTEEDVREVIRLLDTGDTWQKLGAMDLLRRWLIPPLVAPLTDQAGALVNVLVNNMLIPKGGTVFLPLLEETTSLLQELTRHNAFHGALALARPTLEDYLKQADPESIFNRYPEELLSLFEKLKILGAGLEETRIGRLFRDLQTARENRDWKRMKGRIRLRNRHLALAVLAVAALPDREQWQDNEALGHLARRVAEVHDIAPRNRGLIIRVARGLYGKRAAAEAKGVPVPSLPTPEMLGPALRSVVDNLFQKPIPPDRIEKLLSGDPANQLEFRAIGAELLATALDLAFPQRIDLPFGKQTTRQSAVALFHEMGSARENLKRSSSWALKKLRADFGEHRLLKPALFADLPKGTAGGLEETKAARERIERILAQLVKTTPEFGKRVVVIGPSLYKEKAPFLPALVEEALGPVQQKIFFDPGPDDPSRVERLGEWMAQLYKGGKLPSVLYFGSEGELTAFAESTRLYVIPPREVKNDPVLFVIQLLESIGLRFEPEERARLEGDIRLLIQA